MSEPAVIGLDTAKNVFQVHALDTSGVVVRKRKLSRRELVPYFGKLSPCIVGMEACATSQYWARELMALGHTVKLMTPSLVKPYVKTQKNDAADAEAICEAMQRPTMRFVPIKTPEQQAMVALHSAQELLTRQEIMLTNACRGCLAEFGLVGETGRTGFAGLLKLLSGERGRELPPAAHAAVNALLQQLRSAQVQLRAIGTQINAWHRKNAASRRLATIPGVGPITATAIAAHYPNPHEFRSGRGFAAFLGLVPRQFSSGGKTKLGHITKRGNTRIRTLLVLAARNVLWRAKRGLACPYPGLLDLMARKPHWVAAVALANKMARVVWAILTSHESFQPCRAARA